MSALFDLSGKVVLVTGGNSGIGLGFAQGCARNGAELVIWGRRAEKNALAADELRALGAPEVYADEVDVRSERAVIDGVARAVERAGRIDCAFVNAGILSVAPSFMDMTSETYHDLLAVSQHGGFYTLREVCRHMRDRAERGQPGGSIVICGSLSIFAGIAGLEHYGAAKGALAAMLKGVAVEMAPYGARANMIAFGAFLTEQSGAAEDLGSEEGLATLTNATPMRRLGQLSDIHGLAVYFASDASVFHTGDIVTLDGGRMANFVF